MRNFTHRCGFYLNFPKLGQFFPNFEKGQGRPTPTLSPLVTRLIDAAQNLVDNFFSNFGRQKGL